MALEGLHHITAITADAPRNVDFYARVLGLRLVKKTVNFDQPDVYHLYFGDERGTPGLDPDLLRVPRRAPGPGRRRHGPHHPVARARPTRRSTSGPRAWPTRTSPPSAPRTARWRSPTSRACATSCSRSPSTTRRWPPTRPTSPPSTRCWASTACAPTRSRPDASTALLEAIGFAHDGGADWTLRGARAPRGAALRRPAGSAAASPSAGTVHHVAWSAADDAELEAVRARAVEAGARATEIIDRQYFHSVYFREPSGVLFELASRDIGFDVRRAARVPRRGAQAAAAVRGSPRAARAGADAADQPARRDDRMTELVHEIRPAAGEPQGALVLMHGRGADEHDLSPFLDLLDPKRRLVGVTPGGPLFLPPGGRHWYVVPRVGFPDPDDLPRLLRAPAARHPAAHRRAVGAHDPRRLLAGHGDGLRPRARRRAPARRRASSP